MEIEMHAPSLGPAADSLQQERAIKMIHANILASKAVADIVSPTLGPRSMFKMVLDAAGGIGVTNGGDAIVQLNVTHPAAKLMVDLIRTQDEEVGDGKTSVVVLAGEMLHVAEALVDKKHHPTVINQAYIKALKDAVSVLDELAITVDVYDYEEMLRVMKSRIETKFSQFEDLIAELAAHAIAPVVVDRDDGSCEIDIKNNIKVEKVLGGRLEDSEVLDGVMINKNVAAPAKMRNKIPNPRILLLDFPLEYKKDENHTNGKLLKEEDCEIPEMEQKYMENLCAQILKFKPDLVITEKGLSDLACHILSNAGVSAISGLTKSDNNRIAKACGGVIVDRLDKLQESDIGTGAKLFKVRKVGDEVFSFIVDCEEPKACTVLLRGASKDLLNEVERNLQNAIVAARNIIKCPKLVPGGGATELTVSAILKQNSSSIEGVEKCHYEAAAIAFEAIPRTLAKNCGLDVIQTMTALQGKHVNGENALIGIDGNRGEIADMRERTIWDSYIVKKNAYETAIEAASMLLTTNDIPGQIKKQQASEESQGPSKRRKIEQESDTDDEI